MPINQPDSALARAERLVDEALNHLIEGDTLKARTAIRSALGALNFAGNSQQKLIDALNGMLAYQAGFTQRDASRPSAKQEALEAIKHAEGPGID